MNDENKKQLEDMFGPVIFAYTRAQAIEDGVLVDVSQSEAAVRYQFLLNTVVTESLWNVIAGSKDDQEETNERLTTVLRLVRWTIPEEFTGERNNWELFWHLTTPQGKEVHCLRINISGGDNGEPVITIGFPEDF